MSELTPQQALFVKEYLVDLNAGQAAKRAGYSEHSAFSIGSRLLKNVNVYEAVEAARKKRGDRLDIKADRIVAELLKIALFDVKDITEWDEDRGVHYLSSDDIDDEASAAIAEITDKSTSSKPKGGDEVFRREIKIKAHDKLKALDMLGRYLGLFKDAPEPEKKSHLSEEQRDAILRVIKSAEPPKAG